MEKIGITCTEIRDKDSRKLIFVNDDLKLKFFLAKGPDVPTYVEYGAADIGVVGKDTLLEERRRSDAFLSIDCIGLNGRMSPRQWQLSVRPDRWA